jgi:hypothetical protein
MMMVDEKNARTTTAEWYFMLKFLQNDRAIEEQQQKSLTFVNLA